MGVFLGTFTAESGIVTVEIDGDTIIPGSGTFRIHDIGKLEFSNEIPNKDEPNPNAIITKQGGITLQVRDTLTNGASLFSSLSQIPVGSQLNVILTVGSLPTLLALRRDGVAYDAETEMVDITFRSRWDYMNAGTATSFTYNNIEAPFSVFYGGIATPNDFYNFNNIGGLPTGNSVSIHEVISDWMEWVYGSNTTYIRSSNRINASSPTGRVIQDFDVVASGNIHLICPTSADVGVLATISRVAALEGSTFGNAFGVNYYINRLDLGSDATSVLRPEINYNLVQKLTINYEKENISNVRVRCLNYFGVTGANATANVASEGLSVNTNGGQVYLLDFLPVNAYPAVYASGNFENILTDVGTTVASSIMFDAVKNGVRTYVKALGADGGQRIKFKFRNATSLRPYQAFTLSSGAPAVFRASGASSIVYRPSRLFYDFKGDYVEGEAYAIGAV